MKISLVLGARAVLSRQTALGCLTTNLAAPGFGSLLAGRRSGYPQVVLFIIGFALTLIFGVKGIAWCLANWAPLHDDMADPMDSLFLMWQAIRWAVLGMGLFAVAWFWALFTGLSIVRGAKDEPPLASPPIITH
jgi:hypothetical protein